MTEVSGFLGTTYSRSGLWGTPSETLELWDSATRFLVENREDGELHEGLYYEEHLTEHDKYPVYLDGNHPYTVIKNANATSDEKLLIVKDSFAHSLTPFLADHYAEIIMVDMRYYANPIPDLVKQEGIDRVLFVYSIDNLAKDDRIALIE